MRVSKCVLIGFVVILSVTLSAQAFLAESVGTSNAKIEFFEDTSVPPVLDPDNPTEPYDPGGGTGNAGPLSLDYVSNLEFWQQKVSLQDETYNSFTLKPFIQVTDKRANPTGWHVTVKATPFTSASTHQLSGAYMIFNNGETLSDLGAMYGKPIAVPFTLYTDNQSVKVVSANPNEGRGSWITRWYPSNPSTATTNDNVTLTVYGGTMKAEAYTSTLTWTLTDAP